VVQAARKLDLSPEQQEQLETVIMQTRKSMATRPPRGREQQDASLEKFVTDVRVILTSDQATQFDQLIEEVRYNAPSVKAWTPPAPPAAPPEPPPADEAKMPAKPGAPAAEIKGTMKK
jgi:hypothetical protein